MTTTARRRQTGASIVGVGTTRQGKLAGRDADDIAIEALGLALEDASLTKHDIDGLITCKSAGATSGIDTNIGRRAGMNPAYSATLDYGTCNFSLHLAAMAIASGLATTVACLYGTNQRTGARNTFTAPVGDAWSPGAPYGFFHIAGPAALAFRRHQHEYGTTERQLAEISTASRRWAALNPGALFQDPVTIDEYLETPYLVEPLRRMDVTMVSDGGAALIVTSSDRASDRPKRPVHLLGMSETTSLRAYQNDDQLMRGWLKPVADRVFASAELTREDVDLVYIQDPSSIWILQMLEWYGFCGVGEVGSFLEGGTIAPGGSLPVNTNGGQLSEAYMWGWLHLCEAVRQLRGEAGDRQVGGASTAIYCSTKAFDKGAASILGTVSA